MRQSSIFIVSGLAAFGAISLACGGLGDQAKEDRARLQLQNLRQEVLVQTLRDGRPPMTLDDIDGLDPKDRLDPWDREFYLLSPGPDGSRFALICVGPDGLVNTPDDIELIEE